MPKNRSRDALPPLVSPPVAAAASLLVPGLGQALARELWRGLLLLGSIAAAAGMLVWRVFLLGRTEVGFAEVDGLMRRIESTGSKSLVIGISGGLDSTHALIVAARACDRLGLPRTTIRGYTMPGFATSEGTRSNAWKLMNAVGITAEEIDIRPAATRMLEDIGHAFAGGVRQAGGIRERVPEPADEGAGLVLRQAGKRLRPAAAEPARCRAGHRGEIPQDEHEQQR